MCARAEKNVSQERIKRSIMSHSYSLQLPKHEYDTTTGDLLETLEAH